MSIIIYGPQGCGKGLHAEQLRCFFKLDRVIDDDHDQALTYNDMRRLMIDRHTAATFKAGRNLYLTCETPPDLLKESRRVIAFSEAMHMLEQSKGAMA